MYTQWYKSISSLYLQKKAAYQHETLAYQARVTADGGTIINLGAIDLAVKNAKANGYWSTSYLNFWYSALFGVKKDLNGYVSKWYDLSPNSNDAVQTTGTLQPQWLANQKGSLPAVYFSGSNYLSFTTAPYAAGATPFDILAVVKPNLTSNDGCIFDQGNFTHLEDYRLVLYNESLYFSNISNDRATASGTLISNTNYILEWVYAGTVAFSSSTPSFYVNRGPVSSTVGTGTGVPNLYTTIAQIGMNTQSGEYLTGNLYEIAGLSQRVPALTAFEDTVWGVY